MRNDRRSIAELNRMINSNVRVRLSEWERNNIKTLWSAHNKKPWPRQWNGCGTCWRNAIESLSKAIASGTLSESAETNVEGKPVLFREKMIFPKQEHGKPTETVHLPSTDTEVDVENKPFPINLNPAEGMKIVVGERGFDEFEKMAYKKLIKLAKQEGFKGRNPKKADLIEFLTQNKEDGNESNNSETS